MKKIIYLNILLSLFLISCLGDNSNYDYDFMEEVTISHASSSYTVTYGDSLIISPTVTTGNDEEYSYRWTMYNDTDWLAGGPGDNLDTISYDKNLAVIANFEVGDYTMMYYVVHKETGYEKSSKVSLSILTDFSRGWYFLKTTSDDNTELDFHNGESMLENSLQTVSGVTLEGASKYLTIVPTWIYNDKDGNAMYQKQTLFITTEKDAAQVLVEELKVEYDDYEDFFYGEPSTSPPLRICTHYAYWYAAITPSALYINSITYNQIAGKWGYGLSLDGAMDLSDQFLPDYTRGLLFDKNSMSFLYYTYGGVLYNVSDTDASETVYAVKPNNMDCYPLKITWKGYTVMDNINKQERYIIKLWDLFNSRASNTLYNPIDPAVDTISVAACPEFYKSEIFAGDKDHTVFYYGNEDKVSMYNMVAKTETASIATFDGEEITYIKNYCWSSSSDADYNFNYLVVATYKDGRYKVYMYSLISGIPDPSIEPIIYEGEGKITDMCYVTPVLSAYSCNYYTFF